MYSSQKTYMNTFSAIIPQESLHSTQNYNVKIRATKNAIFAIEARFMNTVMPINDFSFRVEELGTNESVCYSYVTKNLAESLVLKAKTYGSPLNVRFGSTLEEAKSSNVSFSEVADINKEISKRQVAHYASQMIVCIEATGPATFYVRLFRKSVEKQSDEFIYLLKKLMDSDDYVDKKTLGNRLTEKSILRRMLIERETRTEADPVAEVQNVVTQAPKEEPKTLFISGIGITAVVVSILLMVPVMIAINCMNQIFVTNKYISRPISLGKVEH